MTEHRRRDQPPAVEQSVCYELRTGLWTCFRKAENSAWTTRDSMMQQRRFTKELVLAFRFQLPSAWKPFTGHARRRGGLRRLSHKRLPIQ